MKECLLDLTEMLVQFTPQRALFSAIFFVNCITFLVLFKQLTISRSNVFGSSNNLSNIQATSLNGTSLSSYESLDQKVDLECVVVDELNKKGIVIALKTGAQEISALSIHFSTTLRCFEPEDILIFSDLEQTVGNFKIHDALRNVDEHMKNEHADFEIYRTIQHYNATGQDLNSLKEEQRRGDNRAGWKLDKYKFLHMVEDVYEMRPDANWYAFVETDTYMFWPNLIKWLERWESSEPLYMGSPTRIGSQHFAHGGSGYVISKTAMANLLVGNKDHQLSALWDEQIQSQCCGDYGLGKALWDTGTPLIDAWPVCNGEPPATVPFGGEHWCQPIVTMHHATPEDISNLWRFQRHREDEERNQSPILYRDVHDSFLLPQFPRTLDNWDNVSTGMRYTPPEPEDNPVSDSDTKKSADPDPNSKSDTDSDTSPPLDHDPSLASLHGDISPNTEPDIDTKPPLPSLKSNPNPKSKAKTPPNTQSTRHPLPKLKTERSSEPQRTLTMAQENAYKSFEHCAKACEDDDNCFQYSFIDYPDRKGKEAGMGECVLGWKGTWTWGRYKEGVRSGWVLERIREWVGREENQCKVPAWVD